RDLAEVHDRVARARGRFHALLDPRGQVAQVALQRAVVGDGPRRDAALDSGAVLGIVLEVDPEPVVEVLAEELLRPALAPAGAPRMRVHVHQRLLDDHVAVEFARDVAAGPVVLPDDAGDHTALRVDRRAIRRLRAPELVPRIVGLHRSADLVAVVGL